MDNQVASVLTQADFGLLALFLRASLTVKLVMIALVLSSIWGWSVIISKTLLIRQARTRLSVFSRVFWSGEPLDQIYQAIAKNTNDDAERVFSMGMKEWQKNINLDGSVLDGAQERIERAMAVSLQSSRQNWEESLNVLGTIGAIAPFIGLFGTVWGIKNSFQDIALQSSTNLNVVAPGIAEALVATALGLVAAIPAVIFYNKLQGDVEKVAGEHEGFAEEFALHISRKISKEAS